jgi:hypothetical protein
LPQKTRRAQRKALLWFLNFAQFASFAAEKYFFSAVRFIAGRFEYA